MSHRRLPLHAAAAAVALLTGITQVHALNVTVNTMTAAEWTAIGVTHAGPTTLTLSTPATGGNPDSFWRNDWSVPVTTPGLVFGDRRANIFQLISYDPSAEGALGSLSIGFDFARLASTFSNGSAGFLSAAVEQGGRIFIQATGTVQALSGAWQSTSFSSASAADWVEFGTNAHPDFSTAGGALHFGYRFSLNSECPSTATACTAVSAASGLDNFRVNAEAATVLTPVPEPETWALMLGGLVATSIAQQCRRRRRG